MIWVHDACVLTCHILSSLSLLFTGILRMQMAATGDLPLITELLNMQNNSPGYINYVIGWEISPSRIEPFIDGIRAHYIVRQWYWVGWANGSIKQVFVRTGNSNNYNSNFLERSDIWPNKQIGTAVLSSLSKKLKSVNVIFYIDIWPIIISCWIISNVLEEIRTKDMCCYV